MITSTRCFEAHCDECGATFGREDTAAIHYSDATTLERDLETQGWAVTGNRVLCPSCQHHIACTLIGHHWKPWRSLAHLCLPGLMRSCKHCGTAEFDPPVHPVSDHTRAAP